MEQTHGRNYPRNGNYVMAMMKYVDGAGWGKIDGDGVGTAKIHTDGLVIGTVYYIVSVSIMFRRSEVHSSYSRFTALRIINRIFFGDLCLNYDILCLTAGDLIQCEKSTTECCNV